MSNAIVISSAIARELWLNQCLRSLRTIKGVPVIIFRNSIGRCESESLRQIALHSNYSEAIYLHDSMELLDDQLLEYCFGEHAGKNIGFMGGSLPFGMFAGKFLTKTLRQMSESVLAISNSKVQAVEHEINFGREMNMYDPSAFVMPDPLCDGDTFVERFGRNNMVLENVFLRKWKGCWSHAMAMELDRANGLAI